MLKPKPFYFLLFDFTAMIEIISFLKNDMEKTEWFLGYLEEKGKKRVLIEPCPKPELIENGDSWGIYLYYNNMPEAFKQMAIGLSQIGIEVVGLDDDLRKKINEPSIPLIELACAKKAIENVKEDDVIFCGPVHALPLGYMLASQGIENRVHCFWDPEKDPEGIIHTMFVTKPYDRVKFYENNLKSFDTEEIKRVAEDVPAETYEYN